MGILAVKELSKAKLLCRLFKKIQCFAPSPCVSITGEPNGSVRNHWCIVKWAAFVFGFNLQLLQTTVFPQLHLRVQNEQYQPISIQSEKNNSRILKRLWPQITLRITLKPCKTMLWKHMNWAHPRHYWIVSRWKVSSHWSKAVCRFSFHNWESIAWQVLPWLCHCHDQNTARDHLLNSYLQGNMWYNIQIKPK